MQDRFRSRGVAQRRSHPRTGGAKEISRWCNHRTTPTNHEPRPGRAREAHTGSGGQHRQGTFERFSHPCRGASRIGDGGRFGSGGSRSLRDLHHRLISFEPPARLSQSFSTAPESKCVHSDFSRASKSAQTAPQCSTNRRSNFSTT